MTTMKFGKVMQKLFESYLSNRKCYVDIKREIPEMKFCFLGVSHEPIQNPILSVVCSSWTNPGPNFVSWVFLMDQSRTHFCLLGVPHGPIQDSILFIIYIRDLLILFLPYRFSELCYLKKNYMNHFVWKIHKKL